MINCHSCNAELSPGDRFCGDCGTPATTQTVAASQASPPPAEPQSANPGTLEGASPFPPIFLVMATLGLITVIGFAGYLWSQSSFEAFVEETTDQPVQSANANDKANAPRPDTENAQTDRAVEGAAIAAADAAEAMGDAAEEAMAEVEKGASSYVLNPGRWEFSMEVIESEFESNGSRPIFEGNVDVVGQKDSWSMCLSEKQANDPGRNLIGLRDLRQSCSGYNGKFESGRYNGTMRCTNEGVDATVKSNGTYDQSRIDATSYTRFPAPAENGQDHIIFTNRIVGRHRGSC